MYSLPTRMTLAALTMASAASTDPMKPLVSTRPSASEAMRGSAANSNRLRQMRQLRYHRRTVSHRDRFRSAVLVCAAAVAVTGCRKKDTAAPPVATPAVSVSHARARLGSPLDIPSRFDVSNDAHSDQNYP